LTRGQGETNDWDPLSLIRRAEEQIEAHLAGKDAPPANQVISTAHLQGVVWQVDRREFELLAYLKDYSWEERFYHHAHAAGGAEQVTALGPEEDDGIHDKRETGRQKDLFPQEERAPAIDEGMGLSWEEEIDGLQCVVTVGDLGLIKIKGLWVGRDMPQSVEDVVHGLRRIVDRIELSDGLNFDLRSSNEGSQQT
jgi:hypothetical protein